MKEEKRAIWFDFTNVPHVNFLYPIINHFNGYDHVHSVRDFAETKGLFEKRIGGDYFLIGSHMGSNKLNKIYGSLKRIVSLQNQIPYFDIKISVGGDASSIVAKLRGKKSITFDDNEKAPNWRYSRFSDLAFWPKVIPLKTLEKQGFKHERIFQYNGFKEDMYLADFMPDESFTNTLPFNNYVVVRPENIQANYVSTLNRSIVPELLTKLSAEGFNILYLPRYEHDKLYAVGIKNIYVPPNPINGLDACFHASAVLTGAGTFAREAACMGVPAVSFYSGNELLTVDQKMIEMGWMFFSRVPAEIIKKLKTFKPRHSDFKRSINVKMQILKRLQEFFQINFLN